MLNWSKYITLPLSLMAYLLVWILLHPYLGYILDSDAIAYLTIARRVNEDFQASVNGLWSPLNSWLIAPFIQQGLDAWKVAKALNFIFGAIVIVLVHFLFLRFQIKKIIYTILMMALSIAMVYFVYFQMFGDVLQLIFVILYLLVLWSKPFKLNYIHSILCGVIMGIGFYAKAYSLFFFIIHFGLSLYWFYRHQKISFNRAIISYSLGIISIFILIFPWTYALHNKYGGWPITGHAGKLNMSWYINSGKTFNSDIKLLIPPSYNDSPSFWEDPYPSQTNLSSPTSSFNHFIKWMARVAHTLLITVQCYNEISFLGLAILLVSLFYFFYRKSKGSMNDDDFYNQLIIITILVLPLGYWMMHIETRYIWLNVFLLMTLGGVLIEQFKERMNSRIYVLTVFVFSLSFLITPILGFESLKYKNKDLFEYAQSLKEHGIQGKFTSNAIDAGRMWVIAYLSNSSFYTIERNDYSLDELLIEMKRYGIQYFVYQSENNKPNIALDSLHFKFVYKYEGYDLYQIIN